jgi:hypothetical protein
MRAAMAMSPDRRRAMANAARSFAEQNVGIDVIAGRTLQTLQQVSDRRRQLAA